MSLSTIVLILHRFNSVEKLVAAGFRRLDILALITFMKGTSAAP